MRFNSFSRDPIFSDPGDTVEIIYSPTIVDGDIILVPSGCIDIPSEINSHAEDCDMQIIISRLIAGDTSVLRPVLYGDVSGASYDHRCALDFVIQSQSYFDNLPSDIKAKFDNSFTNWFQSAGSADFIEKFYVKHEEVVSDES